VDESIRKLGALRSRGVRIALDDFGTGYSSLAYLSKLPLDTLKIDRGFVKGMTANAGDTTIVSTIISLAQALRLKVVAEGVETEEQAQLLRLLRCDQVQGYLFSRPLPAADIENLLKAL
jgi:EAL domain-containing protein (putative c-di-GMP-specific phosphodiesterase class I)